MSSNINEIINLSNKELLKELNDSILKYINSSYTQKQINDIKSEIKLLISNLEEEQCYILRINKNTRSVSGISQDNLNFNYTYLIPNVLRQCYVANKLYIPNICITYTKETNVYQFEPKLLETDIIKSILYFGTPVNITLNDIIYYQIIIKIIL